MENSMEVAGSVLTFFSKHPIAGTVSAVALTLYGSFIPHLLLEVQIPLLAMQIIQIFFWSLGGIASILTMVTLYKKNFKK